jgi:glycerol-3-phosphate acyltransferase PlsY
VAIGAVIVTYLLGSVSFPYWIARAYGVDLRAAGERKLGGGNLAKSVGLAQGIVGGTLDGAKGFLAVVVARSLGSTSRRSWPAGSLR